MKNKKKNKKEAALVPIKYVQLKFNVPEEVRDRFTLEARRLGKSNNGYFLALWDMHLELYLKLLTQMKANAEEALGKEKA